MFLLSTIDTTVLSLNPAPFSYCFYMSFRSHTACHNDGRFSTHWCPLPCWNWYLSQQRKYITLTILHPTAKRNIPKPTQSCRPCRHLYTICCSGVNVTSSSRSTFDLFTFRCLKVLSLIKATEVYSVDLNTFLHVLIYMDKFCGVLRH